MLSQKQIEALARKNAAKAAAGTTTPRRGFGKKYDVNLKDEPLDEASLKHKLDSEKFFDEMKKRDF